MGGEGGGEEGGSRLNLPLHSGGQDSHYILIIINHVSSSSPVTSS